MIFEISFAPAAAQTYTGTVTVNVEVIARSWSLMSGTVLLPDAAASWSVSSLTFSNVALGTTSAPQTVTLKIRARKA